MGETVRAILGCGPRPLNPGATHRHFAVHSDNSLFLDRSRATMASPASDSVGTSAPLPATSPSLSGCDPFTSPARPLGKPDPPLTPSTEHLLLPCGSRIAHEDSETPTDLGGCVGESACGHADPWVRAIDETAVDTQHVPTLDPELAAVHRL